MKIFDKNFNGLRYKLRFLLAYELKVGDGFNACLQTRSKIGIKEQYHNQKKLRIVQNKVFISK